MAAYCHQLSRRRGKLPSAWVWTPEPFCLRCLPCVICGDWVGVQRGRCTPLFMRPGPHLPFGGQQGLETPQASPPGPANLPRPASSRPPACPAFGRFQCLKIALEETQVWGSRREMSLGRAASSTSRHAGVGGSGRGNPMEARPSS